LTDGCEILIMKNSLNHTIPQTELLDNDGEVIPKLIEIFNEWYDTYSTDGKMFRDDCAKFIRTVTNSKDGILLDDDRVNFLFCSYDVENFGYVPREGFIAYFVEQTKKPEKKITIWENINNMGFRNDLKRFSEPYESPNKKEMIQDENNTKYFNEMAKSYFMELEFEMAKIYSEKAVKVNNYNNQNTYCNLGKIKFEQKEYYEAILNFKKAAELNENNSDVYNNLGICYLNKKEYEQAISNFKIAINLNNNNEEYYNNLGRVYFKNKQYDEAISHFKKAIDFDNDNTDYYKNLIELYEKIVKEKNEKNDTDIIRNILKNYDDFINSKRN